MKYMWHMHLLFIEMTFCPPRAYLPLMFGFFFPAGYADCAVCVEVSRAVVRFLFRSGVDFGSDQRPHAREQVHL